MPKYTPEIKITYGGFQVGGDQLARILRSHTVSKGYDTSTVTLRFTIIQTTEALFQSEVAAVEAAFRKPHQDLTIVQGAQTLVSFLHSTATGFNSRPRVEKRGEPTDTGRSRTYTVTIEVDMPADNSSSSGRRITETSINVAYSPSRRRTVTIAGLYTASGATAARDNYEASVGAFVTSVLTDLGGTYKQLDEPTTDADDANKMIRFNRTYEEIIFTGVGDANANVRREILKISRNKVGPGDSLQGGPAKRFVVLNVQYECHLDKEQSTDLRGLYTSLRSSILTQVRNTLEGGSVAVMDEHPHFDYTENLITASMTCFGASGSNVIENKVTTENDTQFGVVLVPVWNGDPLARYIYQGPRIERRTVTVVQRTLGTAGAAGGGGGAAPGGGGVNAPGGAPGVLQLGIGAGLPGAGFGVVDFGGGLSFSLLGGSPTGESQTALVNAALFAGNEPGSTFGLGGQGGDAGGGPGGGQGGQGGGAQVGPESWIPISMRRSETPLRLGIEPDTLDVIDTTIVTVAEKVKPVRGGIAT